MPCDAATLEALEMLNRESGLSEFDLLVCKAYVAGLQAGYPTATDAINAAMAMGLAKVSERDLEAMLVALISTC